MYSIVDNNNMKRNIFKNFFLCGFIGWCLECLWTGMASIIEGKDKKLHCTTSMWMFPIYGMACMIPPIRQCFRKCSIFVRGFIYSVLIFLVEYISGSILKKYHACPWSYENARFNFRGVIRLDYAPIWFFVGLLYEKFLCPKSPS